MKNDLTFYQHASYISSSSASSFTLFLGVTAKMTFDKQKELEYYQTNQIPPATIPAPMDASCLKKRPIQFVFEAFNERPQDIFFFTLGNSKYVGRKFVSKLSLDGKITGTKCSQLTAAMILGLAKSERITDAGILLSFIPLHPDEKLFVFDSLVIQAKTEIHFPYPFLNQAKVEDVSPEEFWDPTPSQVSSLNAGEIHIREYTQAFLSKQDLTGKIIYDPACSTGEFLGHIKKCFPKVRTIGQDLNKKMAHHARLQGVIDEVYDGDSKISPVKNESVDFIFIRFLNLEVVSTKMAHEIFSSIANRCKNGGRIIVFGHTPVLLDAQWFQFLGLKVEQCTAVHGQSVFQYYVLHKTQPVPTLSYEHLSILSQVKPSKSVAWPRLFQPHENTSSIATNLLCAKM